MILTFTVSVDVPVNGEENVPYLKHLLAGRTANVGTVKSIIYEGWLTDKNNWAEAMERQAFYEGKLDW